MNSISFSYTLTAFFYIGSLTHIYYSFLPPRPRTQKHIVLFCCLILSPMVILCLTDVGYLRRTIAIFTILPVFLFSGAWKNKLICCVTAYLLMYVNEIICYSLSYSIFFLSSGTDAKVLQPIDTLPRAVLPTAFLTVIFGTVFIKTAVSSLRQCVLYFHVKTLLLIGIPLMILTFQQTFLLVVHPISLLFLLLFPFLVPCIFTGLKIARQQEFLRSHRENQLTLIQKQLSFSKELEQEYLTLRKWNHDIANHFFALSYLLENGRYQEGSDYIRCLMRETEIPPADSDLDSAQHKQT